MSYSDINAAVALYGSTGIAVKQAADGAIFVTGTVISLTGSYTGVIPITGTVLVENVGFLSNITASITLPVSATNPVTASVANFPTGFYARQGASTVLAASASWVVKGSAGKVGMVSVLNSGTTTGYIHDTTLVANASASNAIAAVPAAFNVINLGGFPCANGIVYIAGAGQTASISFE